MKLWRKGLIWYDKVWREGKYILLGRRNEGVHRPLESGFKVLSRSKDLCTVLSEDKNPLMTNKN